MDIIALAVIALLVLLLQSYVLNKFVYRKFEYTCRFSKNEAYEGEEIELVEIVHNKKILPVPWLKVDIHTSKWLEFAATRSVISQELRRVSSSFLLKSYQKTTRRWKVKCAKRGYFRIDGITLLSGDLLGFKSSSIAVPIDEHIIVYPRIIDLDDVFVSPYHYQGDTIVKRWFIDDPFITQGTREYTTRDPMNRIHWLASARYNKLMVRKNEFTAQLNTCVLLNIQSTEHEVDMVLDRNLIEFGIKVCASLLEQSLDAGVPSRFGTNAAVYGKPQEFILTEPGYGREHVLNLFKLLAMIELRNIRNFEYYLEFVENSIRNSEIYLVTAYVAENMVPYLTTLYRNNNRIKILVLDNYQQPEHIPDFVDVYYMDRKKYLAVR